MISARARVRLALGVGAGVLPGLLREGRIMRAHGGDITALQRAGSAPAAAQLLDTWGPTGRAAAHPSLLCAIPFQPVSAVLLADRIAAVNSWLGARDPLARAAPALPVLAAGADAIEGVAHLRLLRTYAEGQPLHDRDARVGQRAALLKWALLAASVGHVLGRPVLARSLAALQAK